MVGLEAAVKVANARGGTRAYFPPSVPATHWLAKLIGTESANRLCHYLTRGVGMGASLNIPLARASAFNRFQNRVNHEIDAGLAEGLSAQQIALRVGVTARAVHRRRAKLREAQE